jgi:hypothetical protein
MLLVRDHLGPAIISAVEPLPTIDAGTQKRWRAVVPDRAGIAPAHRGSSYCAKTEAAIRNFAIDGQRAIRWRHSQSFPGVRPGSIVNHMTQPWCPAWGA